MSTIDAEESIRNDTPTLAAQSPYERYRNYDRILARSREYYRQTCEKRRNQGLCSLCGTSKASPGYVTCEMCRRIRAVTRKRSPEELLHNREYKRVLYNQRIADGLCVNCGKAPAREGKRMCAACAAFVNARTRELKRREKVEE